MSNLFYRRPRLLVLAVALILVAGFSAFEVLPRYEDPELTARNALVFTRYPGADADRVESQVTEKIETELEEIEEIGLLESVSRAGVSIVSIELYDAITADETDAIWSRIRDRLGDAALAFPAGASEPEFEEAKITAWAMQLGLSWELEGEVDHAVLGRLAKDLEDALRAVPGTEETEVFGAPDEEIAVHVDPARLATLGLTPEGLARDLARGDSKVPSGRLDAGASELLLEVEGELDGLERIARVPVLQAEDGTLVRLGEVARIERTVASPPAELALVDGKPGLLVGVRMSSGERIDRWAERTHAALERFAARVPAGVRLEVVFDQSRYTAERLSDLFANLGLGALLVMLVILFTMGWRSAILVGSALPLSALMVLAGMRALGIPIHQMSVTGLIIALGLLIDNAIVMVDEVHHELDKEQPVAAAVAASVRGLAVPLLASTLTTILAFLPLVIAPGPVGEFVGAMSMSVVLAVASSFLLALTVVPALTGLMSRVGQANHEGARTSASAASAAGAAGPASMQRAAADGRGRAPSLLQGGFSSPRLAARYRGVLEVILGRPLFAIGIALVLPVFGLVVGARLQEQFFPPAGRDQAAVELRLAPVSSIERTREAVEAARALIEAHPRVVTSHWVLGRSAPKFYYNRLESVEGQASFASGLVQLDSNEDATLVLRELQASLDAELPAAQHLVRQLEQGPPFDAPVELILQGPDLDVLDERGEALRALLSRVPTVLHTRSGVGSGLPKLSFEPHEEELERVGLDRVGLAERLQAALAGAVGGSVLEGSEELPVRVRLERSRRDDVAALASFELAAPRAAGWVPLEALGELRLVPETSSIGRRNGRRTNEIRGYTVAGTLPADALEALMPMLDGFELPQGYDLVLGGEAAERDDAVGGLAASVGILVVLMVAVLVLSFQSFGLAAIIGAVALLAVPLALGALWTFGHPFGFMAIVGTMGLMGIAINDSIVVLAALRADPRARAGDATAIVDVVLRSTRHVLSTTITTIAGFTPLLMQTEGLWPPLAVSIAGGVVGATLIALTFVPGTYVLATRRRNARRAPAKEVTLAGLPA